MAHARGEASWLLGGQVLAAIYNASAGTKFKGDEFNPYAERRQDSQPFESLGLLIGQAPAQSRLLLGRARKQKESHGG